MLCDSDRLSYLYYKPQVYRCCCNKQAFRTVFNDVWLFFRCWQTQTWCFIIMLEYATWIQLIMCTEIMQNTIMERKKMEPLQTAENGRCTQNYQKSCNVVGVNYMQNIHIHLPSSLWLNSKGNYRKTGSKPRNHHTYLRLFSAIRMGLKAVSPNNESEWGHHLPTANYTSMKNSNRKMATKMTTSMDEIDVSVY